MLIALALVLVLGISAQWLAWRLRLPSILLLMAVGFAAGQGGFGWIKPDEMLGETLLPIVSLAVALLLFEGGLTLRLRDIEGHLGTVLRMVSHRIGSDRRQPPGELRQLPGEGQPDQHADDVEENVHRGGAMCLARTADHRE